MIVFEKDWGYYPNAIVDTQTNNPSFLRVASLFRQMGVRHYYFPLALLQPELQGLDPHSENLTLEQKAKMLVECDNNPWYFLREVVIDRGAGLTIDDCRFRANRGNIAMMWLMLSSIDLIRIQPRQTGKSFETYVGSIWMHYFCYRDTAMNLITKDESLRKDSIAKMKRIRDALPEFLNRNTKADDNNQITLSCKELDNKLYTHVGQKSEKAANNLGRGMTSPWLHFDEPPFIDHIETTVSAAIGSIGQAREIARRKGVPHCNIFTTTAGDKESRDGRYVYDLVSSAATWDEQFYDAADRNELVEMIRTNSHSRAPIVNLTFSHAQLGFSDEWLYETISATRTESENVDRDFFNRWTATGTSSPISEGVAATIRASEQDPIQNAISSERYIFRWYRALEPKQTYVAGLDTSDAIGRDDLAMVVIDPRDGATVGAGFYNETNLMRFAKWLCEFLIANPNIVLIPERRANAQTIIDYLLIDLPERGLDPFRQIYSRIVQERENHQRAYQDLNAGYQSRGARQRFENYRRYFGFSTTASTRDQLYSDTFTHATENCAELIHDRKLIHQILALTVKNGRIDHRNDEHDDMVIAWLLAHWLITHGVNLSHYGIEPLRVLSKHHRKDEDPMRTYEREQQQRIREQIEDIYERLKHEQSQIAITRLENELISLMYRLKDDDENIPTIDALLENAKEERWQHYRSSQGNSRNKHISALVERY